MTARADRAIALTAGGLLALIFTICAAVSVAGWAVGTVEHTSRHVIPGPVRELRVDAGSGDITLVSADGDDVTVDSRAEGSLHAPRLAIEVNGPDVNVKGGCRELGFGRCRTTLVVHLPAGTAVRVEAASGDVEANGTSGNVVLHAASGDVRVRDLSGRLELETGSGDIDGSGLRAPTVRAHTGSGDVELRFAAAPDTADAETGSGDVRIGVPRGSEAYRVEVDTGSGDREVGLAGDPSAARALRARTGSGDVEVGYTDS